MTLAELKTQIDRLLYQHPLADTNVDIIENVGADVHFSMEDSETMADLRSKLEALDSENDQLMGELRDEQRTVRSLELKLKEIERAARIAT